MVTRSARNTSNQPIPAEAHQPSVGAADVSLLVTCICAALADKVTYISASDRHTQSADSIQRPGLPASAGGPRRHVGVAPQVDGRQRGERAHLGHREGALQVEAAHVQPQQRAVGGANLPREAAEVGDDAGRDRGRESARTARRRSRRARRGRGGGRARGERGSRRGGRCGRQVGVLGAPLHAHARLVGAAPARPARLRMASLHKQPHCATRDGGAFARRTCCRASCIVGS